jgi:hypothetical protein
MKINITLDKSDIRSDYLCLTQPEFLEDMVDDAEASEIRAMDVLQSYCVAEAYKTLDKWISKLKHGGLLTIGFVDIYELSKALANRSIPLEVANSILYGTTIQYKSSFTTKAVAEYLQSKGLLLRSKRVQNFRGVITAERP